MADLGIAKKRKRAASEEAGVASKMTTKPEVTQQDLESIKAQLASIEGQMSTLREQVITQSGNDTTEIYDELSARHEAIEILETMANRALGEIEALQLQIDNIDIGAYEVGDFPV